MMRFTRQHRFWALLYLSAILISAMAGYIAFSKLFITAPGINVPRITITPGEPGSTYSATAVAFYLDIPTLGWLVILLSASLCIASSAKHLWYFRPTNHLNCDARIKKHFIFPSIFLGFQLLAYIMMLVDLFSPG